MIKVNLVLTKKTSLLEIDLEKHPLTLSDLALALVYSSKHS